MHNDLGITRAWLLALLERLATTVAFVFVATLLASSAFALNISAVQAAGLAGIAAGLNTLTAAITSLLQTHPDIPNAFGVDLLMRVGLQFGVAFLTMLTAGHSYGLDAFKAAGLAGIASALSLIKGVLAHYMGNPASAALLPARAESPYPGTYSVRGPA